PAVTGERVGAAIRSLRASRPVGLRGHETAPAEGRADSRAHRMGAPDPAGSDAGGGHRRIPGSGRIGVASRTRAGRRRAVRNLDTKLTSTPPAHPTLVRIAALAALLLFAAPACAQSSEDDIQAALRARAAAAERANPSIPD